MHNVPYVVVQESIMAFNNLFSSVQQAISETAQALQQTSQRPRLPIHDLIVAPRSPREAALTIVRLINSRNPNISKLALELLDVCVKNCGFPFHLQIASKEFLNELVRRFPEQPPFIQQWHVGLVQNGKHQNDLIHISDMFLLLSSKGYRFPGVESSSLAVMKPESTAFRSADEMEEEDIAVKKAKLQELLRRGKPTDLEEANQLMKELLGVENKVNYIEREHDELNGIQHAAQTLETLLGNASSPSELTTDPIKQLFSKCKTAQNKLFKLIDEKDDDLDSYLRVNEYLNRALGKYEVIKDGRHAGQHEQQLGNLISFDSEISTTVTSNITKDRTNVTQGNPMDDLIGVFEDDRSLESPADRGPQIMLPLSSVQRAAPNQASVVEPAMNTSGSSNKPLIDL